MSTKVSRSAAACPEGRYTRLPDSLLYVLRPQEHQLLHALLSHRWAPDAEIYPSVTRLAGILGWSERTVQRWLRRLEAGGWIVREARYRDESEWGDRGQTSNRYRPGLMLLPLLPPPGDSPARPLVTAPPREGRNPKYTTRMTSYTGDYAHARYSPRPPGSYPETRR